jgi:hypothetical protein
MADQFMPGNRDMLLNMAKYYDHFAHQLEQKLWESRPEYGASRALA